MTPARLPWAAGLLAIVISAGFAVFVRLPLPFDGFAVMVAAGLAAGLTICLAMLSPAHWVWTDSERLRHAFSVRHDMSDLRSSNVLSAITNAHVRAQAMRDAAQDFKPPLDARVNHIADQIDLIARDLFYDPDALSVHRESLIRSELIEEALDAHAALRRRGRAKQNAEKIDESRARITTVLDALEVAFNHNEARLADSLVTRVDISSATAERLLQRVR